MANGTNGLSEGVEKLDINGGPSPENGAQRVRMARKQSSPMMPAFMVSAPGKVIVFGEHAVVHAKVCFSCPRARTALRRATRLRGAPL